MKSAASPLDTCGCSYFLIYEVQKKALGVVSQRLFYFGYIFNKYTIKNNMSLLRLLNKLSFLLNHKKHFDTPIF